ncbi:MAG: hypothetical protein EOP09_00960, partial [Proteobacteria bacterium]
MFFKKLKRGWKFSLASIALTLAGTSCGLLGNKKEPNKTAQSSQDLGCLDSLGDRVTRFMDGKIEEAEWKETFKCVVDQVNFFKANVAGNDPRGYNQGDIAFLLRTYLVKTKTITDAFTSSIFDIKAGVFGGNPDVITNADLDRFIAFVDFLKVETLALMIPLKNHHDQPSARSYLDLADALATATDHLATYLTPRVGEHSITKESFIPFTKEVIQLFDGDISKVDEYEELARSAKVLLTDGSKDAIEAWAWPRVAREAGALGGLYMAYSAVDSLKFSDDLQRDEYYLELITRAHRYANRIMVANRGKIAYDRIYQVIDALPKDLLTNQELVRALKVSFPNMIEHALGGQLKNALDTVAVNQAFT